MVGTRCIFNFFLVDSPPVLLLTCMPLPFSFFFGASSSFVRRRVVVVDGSREEEKNGEKGRVTCKFLKRTVEGGVKEREETSARQTVEKERRKTVRRRRRVGRYVRDIVKLVIMLFETRFISYCRERRGTVDFDEQGCRASSGT